MRLRLGRLSTFAQALDVGLDARICLPCLSFVSASLREGNAHEARVWTRRVTPTIWIEGFADDALAAVRAARAAGVPRAEQCLADLEEHGAFSVVARAIVLHLASDLADRERRAFTVLSAARDRLELAPPEWN
jgi:hypothetical protein